MPYANGIDYENCSLKNDDGRCSYCSEIMTSPLCACFLHREGNSKSFKTMWQLSFSGLSEEESLALKSGVGLKSLCSECSDTKRCSTCLGSFHLSEALRRTSCWENNPLVRELIEETHTCEVWCTGPLYDRRRHIDLWKQQGHGNEAVGNTSEHTELFGSRITVVGDAAHVMSMFKGQGANQAITDGPLLAKHIVNFLQRKSSGEQPYERSSLIKQINIYEREMLNRSSPHVEASRKAAWFLHNVPGDGSVFDPISEHLSRNSSLPLALQFDTERYSIHGLTNVFGNRKRKVETEDLSSPSCNPFVHLLCSGESDQCTKTGCVRRSDDGKECSLCSLYRNLHCSSTLRANLTNRELILSVKELAN